MRTATLALSTLVLAAALAGCTGNSDAPDDGAAIQSPNPPPMAQAPKPTATADPAPPPVPDPEEVFTGAFEYKQPENAADQPFTVPAGADHYVAEVVVTVVASGAYSVQGEGGQGDPYVVLVDPAGNEEVLAFEPASAGVSFDDAGTVLETIDFTKYTPAGGTWNVGIRGTGYNVQAEVTLTAFFE